MQNGRRAKGGAREAARERVVCGERCKQTEQGGEATCDLAEGSGREKSTTEAGEVCWRGAVGREDCAFQHGLHACADTSRAGGHAWDAGGSCRIRAGSFEARHTCILQPLLRVILMVVRWSAC